MCRGLADVVQPFERRLVGSVEQRDRLGCQRLATGDLAGIGRGLERARELGAVGARGRVGEPLRDRRELEDFECVPIHATSVGRLASDEFALLEHVAPWGGGGLTPASTRHSAQTRKLARAEQVSPAR